MEKVRVPILIGSPSDITFIMDGLNLPKKNGAEPDEYYISVHRDAREAVEVIERIIATYGKELRVIIAGSCNAGGLGGVAASFTKATNAVVIGVRFWPDSNDHLFHDAGYGLSTVPWDDPMLYGGYNTKGFTRACAMALKILGLWEKNEK